MDDLQRIMQYRFLFTKWAPNTVDQLRVTGEETQNKQLSRWLDGPTCKRPDLRIAGSSALPFKDRDGISEDTKSGPVGVNRLRRHCVECLRQEELDRRQNLIFVYSHGRTLFTFSILASVNAKHVSLCRFLIQSWEVWSIGNTKISFDNDQGQECGRRWRR